MLNGMKKGLFAGVGAVLLTKDKIEEITRKLVKDAKISETDARRLADELVETGEQQVSRLEKFISELVTKSYESLGLVRQEEFQKLRHKLDAMELRLSVFEKEAEKDDKKE